MTNKTATATASLVAAVPAAVLGFFLVKTFLTGLGQLTTMFLGLYGVTLAACAAVVFLPFAVMIFGPKSAARRPVADTGEKEPKPEKEAKQDGSKFEEAFDESKPEIEAEAVEEADSVPISTGELEVVQPTPSEEALDTGFDSGTFETDSFDDDEFKFDDEEEEPPKKKKK